MSRPPKLSTKREPPIESAKAFRARVLARVEKAVEHARRCVEEAEEIESERSLSGFSSPSLALGPDLWCSTWAQSVSLHANLARTDPRKQTLPARARRGEWERRCAAWADATEKLATARLEMARAETSLGNEDAGNTGDHAFAAGVALGAALYAFDVAVADARNRANKANVGKHSTLTLNERRAIGKVAYEKLTIHLSAGVSPNDARARAYQAAQEWGEAEYGKQETGGRMTRRSNVYPKRYMVEYAKASGVSIPTAANRGGEQS